jgi:SAM-dependent methyltransferase
VVLEGGAGTGIATRALLRRGAEVVPFDIGAGVLIRARARTPRLRAVVADGASMPFHDGCADLLCFAQSWHWLDRDRRNEEAARVLRDGGRWAAWWSHARADDEPWFDHYWNAVESVTSVRREERDGDAGVELRECGLFQVSDRITFGWVREATTKQWLKDERSKSYIAALPEPALTSHLTTVEAIINERFPTGQMLVRYETALWLAEKK